MATTTLYPSQDTSISERYATANYGSEVYLDVGESYGNSTKTLGRSLIKFNLPGLGKAKSVTTATLKLYHYVDDAYYTRNLLVYPMTRDWVEGEATWNVYSTGNNWSTVGGDFSDTLLGYREIGGSESDGWKEISLDVDEVLAIINGDSNNYGFVLKMATENADRHWYYSSEGTYPPELYLDYEPAATQKNPVSFYDYGVAIF